MVVDHGKQYSLELEKGVMKDGHARNHIDLQIQGNLSPPPGQREKDRKIHFGDTKRGTYRLDYPAATVSETENLARVYERCDKNLRGYCFAGPG